jgi:hypothetical protein
MREVRRHDSREEDSMSKHTPGPWELVGDGVICQAEGYPVLAGRGLEEHDYITAAEAGANAALIAAAPELLAALEGYLAYQPLDDRFDHCGNMNATQLSERDRYVKIRSAARAAVAKAKGSP